MPHPHHDAALGRSLVLDELFDLTLYQELHRTSRGPARRILEDLIPVETRHLAFWRDFFREPDVELGPGRRLKLRALVWMCRLFGPPAARLVLEAIEIYGIRKYLDLWRSYGGRPLGQAVRDILADEFRHEDAIVSQLSGRRFLGPDDVRSVFLGLNDGLVEMLGSVSGFFAAFHEPKLVLMAGSSVAVAGAFSMAAGAYGGASSEGEMRRIEQGKAEFLGGTSETASEATPPLRAAALVGTSYFLGALVPILPILLGARSLAGPLVCAGGAILAVSTVLAFLSGMETRRRVLTNLLLMAGAVTIAYAIGTIVRAAWGIEV